MAAPLKDDWDENAGPVGPPTVSFINTPLMTWFEGIILPPDPIADPEKGYALAQRQGRGVDKSEDAPEGPLVWHPTEQGTPILESEYATLADELAVKRGVPVQSIMDKMQGVTMKALWVQTDYRAKEFFTDPKRRSSNDDPNFVDDGLRRFIIDGKDLREKINDALKALRTRATKPGMTLRVAIKDREPNRSGKGATKVHEVQILAPTAKTMEVVQTYVAKAKADSANAGLKDEWAAGNGEEPPF